jgi:hypothetical protein
VDPGQGVTPGSTISFTYSSWSNVLYDFGLQTIPRDAGAGTASGIKELGMPAGKVQKPSAVTPVVTGFDTLHVMWQDRSSIETGYVVEVSTTADFNPDFTVQHDATGSSLDVTGLDLDTDYYVRVRLADGPDDSGIGAENDPRYAVASGAVNIQGISLTIDYGDGEGAAFAENDADSPREMEVSNPGLGFDADHSEVADIDDVNPDAKLVAIKLEIPDWLDPRDAVVTFSFGSPTPRRAMRMSLLGGGASEPPPPAPGVMILAKAGTTFDDSQVVELDHPYDMSELLAQTGSDLGPTVILYALAPEAMIDPKEIKATVTKRNMEKEVRDTVAVKAQVLDVDVDSNNDNGFDVPNPRSKEEDAIENDPKLPGKVLQVNNGDRDLDGVPDYEDWQIKEAEKGISTFLSHFSAIL